MSSKRRPHENDSHHSRNSYYELERQIDTSQDEDAELGEQDNLAIQEKQNLMDELDKAAKFILKFPAVGGENNENRTKLLSLLCIPAFYYDSAS